MKESNESVEAGQIDGWMNECMKESNESIEAGWMNGLMKESNE